MSFLDVLADLGKKTFVGYVNIVGGVGCSIIIGGCKECDCKKYIKDAFGKRDSEGYKFDCLCGHHVDNHRAPFE